MHRLSVFQHQFLCWLCNAEQKKKPTVALSLGLLLFSHLVVFDFETPWTAACQASLSFTISQNLLKLMSIELVMPSNHLILCCPLLLLLSMLSIRVFSKESVLCIRCQSTGVSASTSVLSMNIQDRFPLGFTGLISLLSKGLSRVFSNTTVWKHHLHQEAL